MIREIQPSGKKTFTKTHIIGQQRQVFCIIRYNFLFV